MGFRKYGLELIYASLVITYVVINIFPFHISNYEHKYPASVQCLLHKSPNEMRQILVHPQSLGRHWYLHKQCYQDKKKKHLAWMICSNILDGCKLWVHFSHSAFRFTKTKLTHWGRDKMAAIFQKTFSNAFSWMKMYEFHLRFDWSLFLRVRLTIFHHWFR